MSKNPSRRTPKPLLCHLRLHAWRYKFAGFDSRCCVRCGLVQEGFADENHWTNAGDFGYLAYP